jgi:hypothetical protein
MAVALALMIARADPERGAMTRALRSAPTDALFRGRPVTADGAPIVRASRCAQELMVTAAMESLFGK